MTRELPQRNDPLRSAIAANAGRSSPESRRAVFDALIATPALVLLMEGEAPEGAVKVSKGMGLRWSTVRASHDTILIAAYSDVEAVGTPPAGALLATIAPAELVRAASRAGHGVMLNPQGPASFGLMPAAAASLARGEMPV